MPCWHLLVVQGSYGSRGVQTLPSGVFLPSSISGPLCLSCRYLWRLVEHRKHHLVQELPCRVLLPLFWLDYAPDVRHRLLLSLRRH
jgi:hypothetical protein